MTAVRRSNLLRLLLAMEEGASYSREKAGFCLPHIFCRENPAISEVDLCFPLGSSLAALVARDGGLESDFSSTSLHVFGNCFPSERVEVSIECGTGIFPDVVL